MFGLFKKSVNYREAWNEYLRSMEPGTEQEIEIRPALENFLIPDNINFNKFVGNFQFLAHPFPVQIVPTKSVGRFQSRSNRPTGYPIWFLACYPDVATWFTDLCDRNIDSPEKAYESVFGKFDENSFEEEFIDTKAQKIKNKHLRTLINHYIANIKTRIQLASATGGLIPKNT